MLIKLIQNDNLKILCSKMLDFDPSKRIFLIENIIYYFITSKGLTPSILSPLLSIIFKL